MQEVTQKIVSPKGKIAAIIHYPDQETERLAILCPGYLDSKDYAHLASLARKLCARGYTVVRFDPIGTWESDGDISAYSITQCLEDVKQVFEYMLSQASYTTVLLGGHSRGGQIAIHYAVRDPRINLVLSIMPPSGPSTGKLRERWEQEGFRLSTRDMPGDRSKTKEFHVPVAYIFDRDNYDVVEDAQNIHVPLILVAGELDDIVPPKEVEDIFNAANEPKAFLRLEGIEHNYRLHAEQIAEVNERILEQLQYLL